MSEIDDGLTVRELTDMGMYVIAYGSKEVAEEVDADAEIGRVVWRYIDRMNDVCPEDPADAILSQFVAEVMPVMLRSIAARYVLTEAGRAALEKSK